MAITGPDCSGAPPLLPNARSGCPEESKRIRPGLFPTAAPTSARPLGSASTDGGPRSDDDPGNPTSTLPVDAKPPLPNPASGAPEALSRSSPRAVYESLQHGTNVEVTSGGDLSRPSKINPPSLPA